MADIDSLTDLNDANEQRIWIEQLTDSVSTRWEDLRFPATGSRLDSASSRYSYDYIDCGVNFNTNARYSNEPLCHIVQMPHGWREGSTIKPHIHWIQEQAAAPNWVLSYRTYNNGALVPASYTDVKIESHAFTWTSGSMVQISAFPDIVMDDLRISCIGDFIIYRDSTDFLGLYGGADPVGSIVLFKEFDIHYEHDSWGSRDEYIK